MHIQERIRNCIIENFLYGSDGLRDGDSLLEHGVVDSTGVLERVLFAEETFAITVDDEEVVPDNFDSVSSLAGYITRKRRRAGQGGTRGMMGLTGAHIRWRGGGGALSTV
jgi:acyl carrier protein